MRGSLGGIDFLWKVGAKDMAGSEGTRERVRVGVALDKIVSFPPRFTGHLRKRDLPLRNVLQGCEPILAKMLTSSSCGYTDMIAAMFFPQPQRDHLKKKEKTWDKHCLSEV